MRLLLSLTTALLFSGATGAQDRLSPEEKREAKVYDWVAEMVASQSDVMKRYAVLIEGQRFHVGSARETTVVHIYANRGQAFKYRALFMFDPLADEDLVREKALQIHRWHEYLAAPVHKYRRLAYSDRVADLYHTKPKEISLSEWEESLDHVPARFAPYYSFVISGAMSLINAGPSARPLPNLEDMLIRHSDLIKTEPFLGGTVRSHWRMEASGWEFTYTHSPTMGFMPIESNWRCERIVEGKKFVDYANARLEWEKIDRFYLPTRIEWVINTNGVDDGTRDIQGIWLLSWAVGKNAPDKLFDPTAEDLREPIMTHFNKPFSRIVDGKLTAAPYWMPPKGLFKESDSGKESETRKQ